MRSCVLHNMIDCSVIFKLVNSQILLIKSILCQEIFSICKVTIPDLSKAIKVYKGERLKFGKRLTMFQIVEVDAVSSSFDYRSALLAIHNQLRVSEVQAMKFLCSDMISIARMEKIRNALELFQELEQIGKIGLPDNVHVLAELLFHIGRCDQLKTLRITKEIVAQMIAEKPVLEPFRVMLYKICEQLTCSDTKELLFIYGEELSRSKRDSIGKPEELFLALEKQCLLNQRDPAYLVNMLDTIGRSDLVQTLNTFLSQSKNCVKKTQNQFENHIHLPDSCHNHLNIKNQDLLYKIGSSSSSAICFWPNNRVSRPINHVTRKAVTVSDSRIADEYPETELGLVARSIGCGGIPGLSSCDDNNVNSRTEEVVNLIDDSMEMPCYSMTRKPRGICIIINNEKFYHIPEDTSSRKMPDREGTKKDANILKDLFSDKLHFITYVYTDLTAEEISHRLMLIAFQDHSDYDCFVCCILSHGILGSVFGVNGKTVEIRDLTNFYKGASCKSMLGKPKIFFIQACQGKDKQPGFQITIDGPSLESRQDDVDIEQPMETIPNEADFLLGYATVPGYVSFRSRSQGSWYIKTLVKMLYQYVDRYDLVSILIKVNEEVSRELASMHDGNFKQSPMPMFTLRKRIFFR